jgi:hypothetical protein
MQRRSSACGGFWKKGQPPIFGGTLLQQSWPPLWLRLQKKWCAPNGQIRQMSL